MITEPFPFNDSENVSQSVFSLQRPDDLPVKARNRPVEYFTQGPGYWSGSVTGFYDSEEDIAKIKGFLNQYSDGRQFDLNLSDYFNPFTELKNVATVLTPTESVTVGGQHYLQFSNAVASALSSLKSNNAGKRVGFKRNDYISYKGQLFQLPADQDTTTANRWRIPLFPNIKFDAFRGNISKTSLEIKAALDKERGIPELGYTLDSLGLITIPWVQGVQWG